MSVAVITGASRGLGRALALALAGQGWALVVDARTSTDLVRLVAELEATGAEVTGVTGDVADPLHRLELAEEVSRFGGLDLLVNNASTLGPSPRPNLADYPVDALSRVYEVNVVAPLAIAQALLPALRRVPGAIVNITSDASVEPYEGWGGYGSSKAALDQLTAILGVEESSLRVYVFDPGDMRTRMHQEAFPGEDISDRPDPESVVPALLRLIRTGPPSGRYRAASMATTGHPA